MTRLVTSQAPQGYRQARAAAPTVAEYLTFAEVMAGADIHVFVQ